MPSPLLLTHPRGDLTRTQRMFFRRRLRADRPGGVLHLYADTRYRLFVNGRLVTTGPVRSVPAVRPMFDTLDLTPLLSAGENELLVEVLCQRANNFQAMPGSPGGMAAWGHVGEEDLSAQWQVRIDPAWHYPAPHYSFAQGPTEVADLRLREDSSEWAAAVPVSGYHYGPFAPADLPLPAMVAEPFDRGWDLGVSVSREQRVAVAVAAEKGGSEAYQDGVRPRFAYATFIHSPLEQTVEAGVFWGPHYLNGEGVEAKYDELRGNRMNATLALKAGWNLLYGEPEFFGPVWGVILGLPLDAGLTVRGSPDLRSASRLRVTSLLEPSELEARVKAGGGVPRTASDLDRLKLPFREVPLEEPAPFPARDVSWDGYDPGAARDWNARTPLSRELSDGEVWSVVADFGTEYLGLIEAEVDVPPGTTVDVAYEERRRADGAVQLFSSNPFCDTAERFVLPGGRTQVAPAQPRGGRLVQLTFRATAGGGKCTLLGLCVRDVKRHVASVATLSSADPLLDYALAVSRHTIERTLEDGYVDPWRERGLYLGDAYVAGLAHLCTTTDARHVRHAIRLFADGQREDGQFPCVVPAHLREPHEDFTLIYVDFVWQYVRQTGDTATAAEVLPAIERMFSGSRWVSAESGLWSTDRGRVFLDWGVHPSLRTATENACINALRYRALRSGADMAEATGRTDLARRWRAEAAKVRDAYNRRLWLDDRRGVSPGFAPAPSASVRRKPEEPLLAEGTPLTEHNVHANVLALFSGVISDDRTPALTDLVERQMSDNPQLCRTRGPQGGMIELYFLRFAIEALTRQGRMSAALRLLREHFVLFRERGLVTLPEAIHRALRDRDSVCHCWGGWPLEWIPRRLLGITLQHPLDPSRATIAPAAEVREVLPLRLTAAVGTGFVTVELAPRHARLELTGLAGGEFAWGDLRFPLLPGVNEVALP